MLLMHQDLNTQYISTGHATSDQNFHKINSNYVFFRQGKNKPNRIWKYSISLILTLSNSILLHDIPNSLTSTELDHVCNVIMPYCKEGGDQHF